MSDRDMHHALAFLALSQLKGFGPARLNLLLQQCEPDGDDFYADCLRYLPQIPGLNAQQVQLCCQRIHNPFHGEWKERDQLLHWLAYDQHQVLTLGHADYPELLQQIADPPLMLYLAGNAELLHQPQLAIVGSRKPTIEGFNDARRFAGALSELGWCITSGLAEGIDAAAHQGCLQANGKTLAVLGTGIDRVYPRSNQPLYEQIYYQGLLISEFPLGTAPRGHNFPKRNRIVAGLSVGVLVVEAALKSGSLISARLACESGREVFAIPGSIHQAQYKGCHQLIKQGAKLTETIQDIHEELAHWLQLPESYSSSSFGLTTDSSHFSSNGLLSAKDSLPAVGAFSTAKNQQAVASNQSLELFTGHSHSADPSSSNMASTPDAYNPNLTAVAIKQKAPSVPKFDNPQQEQLWQAIAQGAGNLDALVMATGFNTGEISQNLLMLELSGRVVQEAGIYRVNLSV